MSEVKFSKEHEWVTIKDDVATIGITKHATELLGDIVSTPDPDDIRTCRMCKGGTHLSHGIGLVLVQGRASAAAGRSVAQGYGLPLQ